MFITKNLLRKQNQCCKWDREEMGLPPTQSLAFIQGKGSQKRGWDPLPPRASLLRPLGDSQPQNTGGSPAQYPLLLV